MSKRKKWTAEEKLAIVLDGFKGRSMTEICREYGVSEAQYCKWRNESLSLLREGLGDKRSKGYRDRPWEAERSRLKKKKTLRLPIECPVRSNVRWEGDLTYVWDGTRINYLFAIVDTYDKEPIGDYYGLRCRAEESIISLEEAVKNRFGNLEIWPLDKEPRVRLRVDQGSQYISGKFKKRARELGIKLDYCGINCPDDKPYIESFFARYKCEEVYRND